jgi:type 1 glutamine amidotransferase
MYTRRTFVGAVAAIALSAGLVSLNPSAEAAHGKKAKKHILVVTVTTGFRHDSIPVLREVIQKLGADSGQWDTDYADADPQLYDAVNKARDEKDEEKQKAAEKTLHDAIVLVLQEKLSPKAMQKYDAIVFGNTTGELPLPDPQAFLDYIKAGHGFAAMHSGSDTFHTWSSPYEGKDKGLPTPYVQMLGGEFLEHHSQSENSMIIRDPNHPAMKAVAQAGKNGTPSTTVDIHKNTSPEGQTWRTFDEIYLLKNNDPSTLHVLLDLDRWPNDGSKQAGQTGQHIIAWSKMYGKGRVFYTVLGHRQEMWHDPYYQKHVQGGIAYVLGLAKGSADVGKPHAVAAK